MRAVAVIGVVVAALDQLTKWLIQRLLQHGETVDVVPGFFRIVHWHNTGAAWGLFQDFNTLLIIISVLTVLGLYWFRHSLGLDRWWNCVALGLVSGGVIGNLIDRMVLGYVVDFLDFYIGRFHWPAFNVADSAICVGIGLYLIGSRRTDASSQQAVASR